jgi:hypothetical protein
MCHMSYVDLSICLSSEYVPLVLPLRTCTCTCPGKCVFIKMCGIEVGLIHVWYNGIWYRDSICMGLIHICGIIAYGIEIVGNTRVV